MTKPVRKKLIEVALPLEAINAASAREKSIRHGHPSTLHLWWARRPLAAARAVIFAQMVDDPSSWPDLFPTEKKQEKERQRLFKIIEELVQWENTTKEEVLQKARDEIWRSWRRTCAENADHPQAKELFDRDKLPGFHDPFAGGGALPLEAQRLGLESYASDLNPVAVLINKAMIEIPPKFAGQPPLNPEASAKKHLSTWEGAQGLAEDVRYYGQWMRDEAEKRIGHLYPKVRVTKEMIAERPDLKRYDGKELTVVAWIWARTVKSPNPAFRHVDVPLVSSFVISAKSGNEAYVVPVAKGDSYSFSVRLGKGAGFESAKSGTKLGRGNFRCVLSDTPISSAYIKSEGKAGRISQRLVAIIADGERRRVFLSPRHEDELLATSASPAWRPDGSLPSRLTGGTCVPYGLTDWSHLFTDRQAFMLHTFVELVSEARTLAESHFRESNVANVNERADAVALYLAFLIDQVANHSSNLCGWNAPNTQMRSVFARQALPMVWDFAECNVFSQSSGSLNNLFERQLKGFVTLGTSQQNGTALQADARKQDLGLHKIISTDPPYYDNIAYADLSDFFYAWLRKTLRKEFPELTATIASPKDDELVATAYRHGGRDKAEAFFLHGMTEAMKRLASQSHPAFPVTIYYAFKQSESSDESGVASTGWETFLAAVVRAGFSISGTWPIRTEKQGRVVGYETNSLASSIVLVCRHRPDESAVATRRELLSSLQREMPSAVLNLQRGNVAPVDLQQAAIGPGMAIFTRYSRVLDSNGEPLTVRDALTMINQVLDEVLAEQEGDFDSDTRWALSWFEQFGFSEGDYGDAETLSKAKNTSVNGIVEAGIGVSGKGKVRLLKPEELPATWTPEGDKRLTVWDMVHHLIRVLAQGEPEAAQLMAKLGSKAESARELAYRLYAICDRTKRSQDAQRYNGLVQSWPEIAQMAQQVPKQATEQQQSFEGME